ncbi:hypothetical protein, conserved [Plasmodium vivax]|nr:hypothetical protein, conserved [Plasmodium vivax]
MTNDCDGSHHEYLSYKCYKYLSERLNKPEFSEQKEKYLKSALETLGKAKYNEFSKDNLIKNLAARLGNDGVFLHANTNIVCNYINYKLNESLRTHYNYIDRDDYNIFKEFANVFYNKRHNNNDAERSCEKYIKLLGNDIYYRILNLFQMYYHYNELKSPNNYIYTKFIDKFCNNVNLLVRYSNEAINPNTINDEYINSIRKLKDIIEKDEESEQYKKKCNLNVLNGMLSKITNSKVPIPKEQGSALVPIVAPNTQQPDELQHQRTDKANEQEPSQQASKDEKAMDLPSHEQAEWELLSHGQAEWELLSHGQAEWEQTPQEPAAKVQESGIHVKGLQARIYPLINRHVSNDQEVTGRLEGRHILQETEAPSGGTEGVLVKMQGFITDTLGQVEPAPILGVSGGMGALFLLFKYTPVGTFFGRIRGRNHRIPGSLPGTYPGFPEYYDSNFGNMPINISYQAE